jgi:hypothetical protein
LLGGWHGGCVVELGEGIRFLWRLFFGRR